MTAVPIQDSSPIFSYLVNSFLNLLCHEFVLSTTHRFLGEYLFWNALSLSFFPSPLFLLYGIRGTYPRLMISCSTALELYALSRHRCCFIVLIFVLRLLGVGCCCLITALSITSFTAFISCVFADVMTADIGMPFLSVKICLFVPSLLPSVGLLPVIAPLRATLWIYHQGIASSI